MNVHILIPSRMASSRLPGKPLADINGIPMIVRVLNQATKAGYPTTVVCDDPKIKAAVEAASGTAILTDPDLPSGSDRIWQGTQKLIASGHKAPDIIINVQGDEPLFPTALITQAVEAFKHHPEADVVTFAHPITDPADLANPNMVKAVCRPDGTAHYFSRCPVPHGATTMLRHIGCYAYRYDALKAFVAAPVSPLEDTEKLEQLRGLDLGLTYHVAITDRAPIGVDTPEDLAKVRQLTSS